MHSHRRWVIGAACCATLVSPVGYVRQTQASPNTAFNAQPQSKPQPQSPAAGSITGLAFRDYNANGARDPREPGLPGILITAYDATGAAQGSATTANDGSYTLAATDSGPYRIEFTNAPAYLRPGPAGSANGTTVQFVPDGNSANINAGFANSADYVAANPELAVVVFSAGDQSSTAPAIVSHPYSANTDTATGLKTKAKTNEIGSVLGLAYKRATQDLFAAAYTKRGVGFGPGGIGAIYRVPVSGTASVLVDLGSAAGSFSKPRDLNPDPPDFDAEAMAKTGKTGFGDLDISADEQTLWTVNLANRSLYKIDILAAEAGPGDAGATLIGTHPDPGCITGVARPFALEVKDDVVYVGGVCTGELGSSSGSTNTISAYVFTYTESSGWGSQPALNFPLSYPVSCADVYAAYTPNKLCRPGVIGSVADWWSWHDGLPNRVSATSGYKFSSETPDGYVIAPQPILADLEIDGTDMVIGLRDRFGDQVGWDDPGPSGIGNSPFGPVKNMLAISAADILRAGPDGAGKWKIEANASGPTFGPGLHANDGSGPCNGPQGPTGQNCGEFYNDNFNPSPSTGHDETALGSLAQIEGAPEVVATIYDPYRYQSAGTGQLSRTNGERVRAYEIFRGGNIRTAGARLNKVNGLGDVEILTDPAPIELGNRIWRDVNGNGLQDAGEPGIQNVTLRLYRPGMGPDCIAGNADDNAALARAITNDKGEYYFKDGVGADPQIDAVGLVNGTACKLQPGAAYSIRVDNADDYNLDEPLEGLTLTERDDAVASLGGSDRVDSDAALVGRQGWITHTLGSFGENDHSLDFGFVPGVSLGNQVWFDTDNDSTLDPTEVGVGGVTLTLLFDGNANGVIDALEATPMATTTTNSAGFYLFANGLLPGNYAVCIPQPNFGMGGGLQRYHSSGINAASSGALTEAAPAPANTDADNVDDGARQATSFCANGVGSSLITLSNNEPATEVPTNTPATQPGKTPGLTDPVPNANSNVTVDFGFYQAKLGNLVWNDANNNGLRDAAEAGFGAVPVRLFAEDGATEILVGPDGIWGTADDAPGGTLTAADGSYALQGLPQGSYVLRIAPPANYVSSSGAGGQYEPAPDNDGEGSTAPNRNNDDNGTLITSGSFSGSIESKLATLLPGISGTPNLAIGETDNKTLDFGLTRIVDPNAFSLGNRIWMDTGAGPNANNGILDSDERGLPGFTVTLYAVGNPTPILTTTTDAFGYYRFDGLTSGDYVIEVPLPNFFSLSAVGEADPNLNGESNNNCVNNLEVAARTNPITLEPGGLEPTNEPDVNPSVGQGAQDARANMTIDCGLVLPPLSLGNQVFEDKNNDGLFDTTLEVGINGVLLNLYVDLNNDGAVVESEFDTPMLTTTTAFSGAQPGFYLFGNLPPGAYGVGLACGNFDAGGPLHGYASSSGQVASKTGPFEPSGDVDDPVYDDDTLDIGSLSSNPTGKAGDACITMLAMQLSVGAEPTGMGSGNDNSGNPADGIADEEEDPRFDNDFVTEDRNENLVIDFGVYRPYSMGNRVWLDKNDDGLMSSDEPGLPGITVRLYGIANTLLATTTTDVLGYYRFDFLTTEEYIVEVENPLNPNALPAAPQSAYMRSSNPNGSGEVDKDDNGHTSATAPSGRPATRSNPIPIGDAAASDSEPTSETDLESNPLGRALDARYDATVDFGFYEPMQLGSRVFNDENNDGKRVSGERNGVVSVTLKLYKFDVSGIYDPGTPLSSTRPSTATATFSDYFFTDLPPGSYVVEVVPDPDLVGYVSSSGKPGSFSGPYEGLCDTGVNPNDGPGGGINNDDNGFVRADGRIFSCPFVLTNRDENAQDSVTNPNINNTLDFGIFRPLSLGNLVWNDLDDDGMFDGDELPIANVMVNLFWDTNNDGNVDAGEFAAPLVTATTNVSGLYLFTALGAGNYVVELDALNFAANKPLNGFISSDAAENGATGAFEPAPDPDAASTQLDNDDSGTRVSNSVRSQPVTLRPNTEPLSEPLDNDPQTLDADENLTVDFGVYKPFSLGNRVFVDQNGSHRLDAGDVGVGLVTVRLYVSGTTEAIAETATDQTGYYRFDKLRAGHYTVELAPGAFYTDLGKVSPLLGFVSCGVDEADPNSNGDSNDNGLGSATSRNTGIRSNPVLLGKNGIEPVQESDLSSGANPQGADDDFGNMTVDFCFYKLASLGNRVWVDANKDGQQTAGETNIPGVVVTLRGAGNTVVATATTDANGLYTFTQLIPGNYQVCFRLPVGYTFTQKGSNPTGADDSNANPTTGCTDAVALSSGENNPTLDVGVVPVLPQAVTLARFAATAHNTGVWVEWNTGAEVDTFGFVLYRAESDSRATALLVTPEIIPAQGQSASYRFNDLTARAGQRYFYWLVEIERDGDPLEYGPAQLAAAQAPRPVDVAAPNMELPVAGAPVQARANAGAVIWPTQPQQSQVEVVAQRVVAQPTAQIVQTAPQANAASAHTPSNAQPIQPIASAPHKSRTAIATATRTSAATPVAKGSSPTQNQRQAQQVVAHISALSPETSPTPRNQNRLLGLLAVAGTMLLSIIMLGGIGLAWRKRWLR